MFNSKKVGETTTTVATALAKEGSMLTTSMEEYIKKWIEESLAKNWNRGKKT